jgi:hypothetical protein
MSGTITLLGCGDVGPVDEPAEAFCTLAKNTLAQADMRFAQVERVYSERGSLQVQWAFEGYASRFEVNGDEVRVS